MLLPGLLLAQDTTPPDTTITGGPSGVVANTSPSFSFTSTEINSTFTAQMDGGGYVSVSSPKSYSGLSQGSHTFSVRATDSSNNTDPTPATRTFTVDTVLPDTTITGGPSGTTASTSPSFSFISNEAGSTYEVQMDSGGFAAASSPKSYSGLSDGAHTFSVRAVDAAGNKDATPATRSFTIDTTFPDTTITSGPSGTTASVNASFSFISTEAGSTYEAQMDGGGYATASSPKSYTGLSDGTHTFSVRAIDAAGNTDATPATRTFIVDATPPDTTITSGPTGTVTTNAATFSFTSTEVSSTFQVKLDGSSYRSAASPYTWTNLTGGNHFFQVRASDQAGNIDATPAVRSWTIALPLTGSNRMSIARLGTAQATITYSGDPNASYTLQQSSNLLNWNAWFSVVSPTNGVIQQVDSVGIAPRFYRAVASPNGSVP
ncbi:MAG: Ig-like domain-containing protein [Limisphaerales bacterium]